MKPTVVCIAAYCMYVEYKMELCTHDPGALYLFHALLIANLVVENKERNLAENVIIYKRNSIKMI